MTALALKVSQELMRLRMIERALHDQENWGIHCAGVIALATVEVLDDAIRFTAHLPGFCSLGDDFPIVDITKDGEAVWSTRLDGHLGEHGTEVSYEVGFGVPVAE